MARVSLKQPALVSTSWDSLAFCPLGMTFGDTRIESPHNNSCVRIQCNPGHLVSKGTIILPPRGGVSLTFPPGARGVTLRSHVQVLDNPHSNIQPRPPPIVPRHKQTPLSPGAKLIFIHGFPIRPSSMVALRQRGLRRIVKLVLAKREMSWKKGRQTASQAIHKKIKNSFVSAEWTNHG